MTGTRTTPRIAGLDMLRGIAATSVMLFHYTTPYGANLAPMHVHFWPGYYGVELFFIISGFVIFMTVEHCKTVAEFAASRISRLYPVFWAAVLLTAAILWLDPMSHIHAPKETLVAANLTMLQIFVGFPSLSPVYWTLAQELSFYALMAAALFFRKTDRIEFFCFVWLAIVIPAKLAGVVPPYRLSVVTNFYFGQFFICGIALYLLATGRGTWKTVLLLALATLNSALATPPNSPMTGSPTYFPMTVALVVAVWLMVRFDTSGSRLARPLLFLGAISYPLYLVHGTVGITLQKYVIRAGLGQPVALAAAIAASIAVAVILHKAVEAPLRAPMRTGLARVIALVVPAAPAVPKNRAA